MQAVVVSHMSRMVAVNAAGRRIGEDHPRANFSNHEIDTIREMYEEYPVGDPRHIGYRALAKIWECSRETIRDICNYRHRNQVTARHKRGV